jgi:RNA polymerase sigma-70 factor (ECF subfamily)
MGRDATCEALAYAWEHWERVRRLESPAGYLYRVGMSAARRLRRPLRTVRGEPAPALPWVEPALVPALNELTESQRVSVVLVHGLQWTHAEVADLLGIERTTVQNHVERALAKLRRSLEVEADV